MMLWFLFALLGENKPKKKKEKETSSEVYTLTNGEDCIQHPIIC